MKKQLISLLFFLSTTVIFFQEIVDTSKMWGTAIHRLPSFTIITEYIKFNQDTVIDTNTYKKVFRSTDEFQSNWIPYGYIREAIDKKVFYRTDTSSQEYLIYDFEANINDTIDVTSIYSYSNSWCLSNLPFIVDSIDTIFFAGQDRRQYYLFSNYGGSVTEIWLEGIGSIHGILHNWDGSVGGDGYDLLCYWENEVLKYHNSIYSECYWYYTNIGDPIDLNVYVFPNPVTDKLFIEMFNKDISYSVELMNIVGQVIFNGNFIDDGEIDVSGFSKGIYFLKIQGEGFVETKKIVVN
ncbi:MAG: T9SS type A sorting domain-containing protein [Bacteroidota bacterium]